MAVVQHLRVIHGLLARACPLGRQIVLRVEPRLPLRQGALGGPQPDQIPQRPGIGLVFNSRCLTRSSVKAEPGVIPYLVELQRPDQRLVFFAQPVGRQDPVPVFGAEQTSGHPGHSPAAETIRLALDELVGSSAEIVVRGQPAEERDFQALAPPRRLSGDQRSQHTLQHVVGGPDAGPGHASEDRSLPEGGPQPGPVPAGLGRHYAVIRLQRPVRAIRAESADRTVHQGGVGAEEFCGAQAATLGHPWTHRDDHHVSDPSQRRRLRCAIGVAQIQLDAFFAAVPDQEARRRP